MIKELIFGCKEGILASSGLRLGLRGRPAGRAPTTAGGRWGCAMRTALFAAFAVASLLSGLPALGESLTDLTGDWEGVLANEGAGIPLVLHLSEEEGRIRASLDSPVQGAFGLEVTHTRLKAGRLSFRVPAVGGGFRGELLTEALEIRGTWHQGGAKLPLTFRRHEASAGIAPEDLTVAVERDLTRLAVGQPGPGSR